MLTTCGVCVGEIQDYLDEYSGWQEVLLRDGTEHFSLALGFNRSWPEDWTTVSDLRLLTGQMGQWEPLRFRMGGVGYEVVGMVADSEPTLIVERV